MRKLRGGILDGSMKSLEVGDEKRSADEGVGNRGDFLEGEDEEVRKGCRLEAVEELR